VVSLHSSEAKGLVVSLQKFDGSWELSDIVSLTKISQSKVETANPGVDAKIWATALGIAFLEVKCADSKSNWEMVATKARTFVSKMMLAQGNIDKALITKHVGDTIAKAIEFLLANV